MKRLFFLAALSIAGVQPAQADLFKISVDSAPAPVSVDGQDVHGRVFIDFPQLAAVFGAVRRPSKDGELWVFPEHTLRFLPDGLHYKVRLDGDKTWRDRRFDEQTAFGGVPGLVPITALPELFQRSFSYHVQRRRLSVRAANADASRARRAPARHTHVDENDWVSLDDAAKALGVVVLNTQPNHYRLVLPDFTVLEIQVGDNSVVQRGVPFTRLPDPLLLFGGLPYVTSRSLQGLFGNDVRWDPRDAELVIPARYGRLVNAPSVHTLDWEGVREKPLSLRIDELSSFYQEPEPVYPADTAHVYESVRDLRTNEPIQSPNSTPEDRVSGTAVLSLDGTAGGLPVDGRGSFEKVGRREHVVNGSIGVGFPGLRVEGGRMYTTFDGLAGQFNAVDRVTVSHSNDTYGDGDKDTEVVVRAGGGEHTFDMFLSTSAFSQTVSIQQKFAQAGGDVAWRVGEEEKLTLRVDQYLFSSKDVGTSSSFFDEDLLREIFGDQFDFSVDPTEAAALTRTTIADHHATSLFNLLYEDDDRLSASGAVGVSRFSDPARGAIVDADALARVVVGHAGRRLDASFERVGADYRSIGDPTRYQDRKIVRLAPQVDFRKWWKFFGEIRREQSGALRRQGIAPFDNTFASAVNLFSFRTLTLRNTLTRFDSSLYGRRDAGDLNLTVPVGRDSLDLGGGASRQSSSTGEALRNTSTARAGYQFLRPGRRFSVGDEYTWDTYPFAGTRDHETLSTVIAERGAWRGVLQYQRQPREFASAEHLHTGTFTIGRAVSERHRFNLFVASSSLRANLSHPEAWRAGFQYTEGFE